MKKINTIGYLIALLFLFFQSCDEDTINIPGVVRTAGITDVTETSAVCSGKAITNGAVVDEMGICWAKSPNPTVNDMKKSVEPTEEEFTVTLDGLRSGTLYFVRSYFKTADDVVYGDQRSFTCLGQLALTLPFMERFRGDVFPPLYWMTIDKDGDGYDWYPYDSRFFGATSDSDQGDMTPENYLITPKIELTGKQLQLRWSVGVTGRSVPEEHYKVVIAETPFTPENCSGHGIVVFEETMTSEAYRTLLSREVDVSAYTGKDVYVAFVHYDCSDQYSIYVSDIELFSDESASKVTTPQLSINEPSQVGTTTADLSATVVNDGGVSVVRMGFCYSTEANPTIQDAVAELMPHETFETMLEELEIGTTYYVRAFATNKMGTTYSAEKSFTTPEIITETLFKEDFSTDFTQRWTLLDLDGDGVDWIYSSKKQRAYSESIGITPENYMISPIITVPEDTKSIELTFELASYVDDPAGKYQEKYKVIISTAPITADNCRDAVVLRPYTSLGVEHCEGFVGEKIEIPASYAGKKVYIGFVHGDCTDMDTILLKNIVMTGYK